MCSGASINKQAIQRVQYTFVLSLSVVGHSMDIVLQVLQKQACKHLTKKYHSKWIIFITGSVLKFTYLY